MMKKLLQPSIFWLFAFIPVSIILEAAHSAPPLIFFSAALSIVPVAKLISKSTENLAHYTGDAIGGLLNATFGNFPELIISLVALRAGLYEMVLASLIGSVLANLLLALGVSFFVGGLRYHVQQYNPQSTRIYSSMMLIAVISLTVPSGFSRLFGSEDVLRSVQQLNIGLAVLLLITYLLYLFFMIKTHSEFFKSIGNKKEEGDEKHWSVSRAIASLVVASVFAAWMSEILVGAAEETGHALGMSTAFIGLIILAIVGGAAESLSAITMASKNKMDLSISIALGSCIQISLLIAPVLVLLSYVIAPAPMNLTFSRQELGALFFAILIGIVVVNDGKSNWYKGVQLIVIYLIIAILYFYMPASI
jgi:Ca2+:H+ antiporter